MRITNRFEGWNRDWNDCDNKKYGFLDGCPKLGEQEQYTQLDIRRISREASFVRKKKYR